MSRPVTKVRIIRTKQQLEWLIAQLEQAERIAYDIETTTLDEWKDEAAICSIGFSWKVGEASVVPIHHSASPWRDPDRVLATLKPVVEAETKNWIAHNGKFDSRFLANNGIFIRQGFDTMLAAHLLDENRYKGLKPLAEELLGAPRTYAMDMSDNYNAPLKPLCIYNGKDCDYTLRLYELFREELRAQPRLARVFKLLMMPASNTLTKIELGGIYLDPDKLEERYNIAVRNVEKLEEKLRSFLSDEQFAREGKKRFNFNSPQQVGELLFTTLGLEILEKTGTGKPSTSESVLLRLKKEHIICDYLLTYRKWKKYVSTYLRKWKDEIRDRRSRIHPNYKLYGTVTGRLSESGTGLQQVPRDPFIRGILGAPQGWVFVEADYSQVELRIAACLANESHMLRQFAMGVDVHLTTAASVTGKAMNEITSEERKMAKAVNFGFLYGMGAGKFVSYARDNYDVVVSPQEAYSFRRKFFDTYPRLQPWHDRQRRIAKRYGEVQSRIGRVRHLPDVSGSDEFRRAEAERQAINSPVQSLASDLMLISMLRLDERFNQRNARIVGSVHDSILMEIREDQVDTLLPVIKNMMENPPIKKWFGADLEVPIEIEAKTGKYWSEGMKVWNG